MIPLEKLIEYKGNRYELTKAMIELAHAGKNLLKGETKYRKSKYIPVVIYNVLEGKIKFCYDNDKLSVDENAPFLTSQETYDETIYEDKLDEDKLDDVVTISEDIDDDDFEGEEDDDDDFEIEEDDDDDEIEIEEKEEKPKAKRTSKKTKS